MPEITQEVAEVSLDLISLNTCKYMVWEPRRVLSFQMMNIKLYCRGGSLSIVAKRLQVALGRTERSKGNT